jgi:hypothetical protein
MSPGLEVAVAAAVTVVALLVLVVVAKRAARARGRLEDELAASREELVVVQRRLDALARRIEPRPVADPTEYVITTAGEPDPDEVAASAPPVPVTGRQFASMALGESLVTIFSFGYGVRRALSAENRNRIGFEMRREVRRSRKERKRVEKQARRHLRATDRATLGEESAA